MKNEDKMLRIVITSDTHGFHNFVDIPNGDVLVHGGDFTLNGDLEEVKKFNDFLKSLPHKYKIVIAGNHDFCMETQNFKARQLLTECVYLQDSAVDIEGLLFYGSPWQPEFMDFAFNLPRGDALKAYWERIPSETDVLITHGPPFGHGDRLFNGEAVGCNDLLKAVKRVQPVLHVFGHIHEGYGQFNENSTAFINSSNCDLYFRPVNPPIVYDYHLTR